MHRDCGGGISGPRFSTVPAPLSYPSSVHTVHGSLRHGPTSLLSSTYSVPSAIYFSFVMLCTAYQKPSTEPLIGGMLGAGCSYYFIHVYVHVLRPNLESIQIRIRMAFGCPKPNPNLDLDGKIIKLNSHKVVSKCHKPRRP
jgi:hypothetical protein